MARPKHVVLEYRNYELPADFPILVLTGDRWHISPVPGKHLHIHNCLEIGLCHSSGGTMVFDHQQVHFAAGDVTCIARNVPHTTWSNPEEASRWSYLFLDVEALLGPSVLQHHSRLKDTGRFLKPDSLTEETLAKTRALKELAESRGQKLHHLALQWVLRDNVVTSALIGASRPEQILDNLAVLSAPPLTEEELRKIDTILG